jgi:hypothetical protein
LLGPVSLLDDLLRLHHLSVTRPEPKAQC